MRRNEKSRISLKIVVITKQGNKQRLDLYIVCIINMDCPSKQKVYLLFPFSDDYVRSQELLSHRVALKLNPCAV